MSVVHHIQSTGKLSIVVTDTIPVVSNRPSGVAPKRPDEVRLLVTTAAIVDNLAMAKSAQMGARRSTS